MAGKHIVSDGWINRGGVGVKKILHSIPKFILEPIADRNGKTLFAAFPGGRRQPVGKGITEHAFTAETVPVPGPGKAEGEFDHVGVKEGSA